MLFAASVDGVSVNTGPVDLDQTLKLMDVLTRTRWQVRFRPDMAPTPLDIAERIFRATDRGGDVPNEALFTGLRGAVFAAAAGDTDRAASILTHLEPHRPLAMLDGEEACVLGECDHIGDVPGECPEVRPAGEICLACSVLHHDGSEWGPECVEGLQVAWPCAPICNAVRLYNLDLVTTDGRDG